MKFDSWQADCSVAWLSEVLALFTIGLQLCQQLKDKVSVFAQYKDFNIEESSIPQTPSDNKTKQPAEENAPASQ